MRASNMINKKGYRSSSIGLSRVLKLDPIEKTILVQPGITMEELAEATLPYGLIPPVVPEFKGITVGGAINGAALESTSCRFGQFNDICLSYEIKLGDGSITAASPEKNPDLFYGIAGSYGTLGTLLSVKIQLLPTTGRVEVAARRFDAIQDAVSSLTGEAIVFSKKKTVAVSAKQITEKEAKHLPHSNSDWFYSHCDKFPEFRESMRIKDYLFRHDRGAFWMGGYALRPSLILSYCLSKTAPHCTPKNPGPLFRTLFGSQFSSQKLYARLHKNRDWFREQFVVQDFYLPQENAANFAGHVIDEFKIAPLWLCPIRSTTTPQLFSPHMRTKEELLVNVGVYGIPHGMTGPQAVSRLEKLAAELGGRKMLYSHNMMTESEFWDIYPREAYEELRKKYKAEGAIPGITGKLLTT